ncbi:MAG: hypothetical protein IID63_07335 [candidate division Zixibacteria bacterium]|nr:hypothetical protein [candidate division Zixibacteria bacterium]
MSNELNLTANRVQPTKNFEKLEIDKSKSDGVFGTIYIPAGTEIPEKIVISVNHK